MNETIFYQIMIAHLIALPALLVVATCLLRERKIRTMLTKPQGVSILPSAKETRSSILRFQETVRRNEMLDFIWEQWLRNRILFFR